MIHPNFSFAGTRVADASGNWNRLLLLYKSVASIALQSMCQSRSGILGSTCYLRHFTSQWQGCPNRSRICKNLRDWCTAQHLNSISRLVNCFRSSLSPRWHSSLWQLAQRSVSSRTNNPPSKSETAAAVQPQNCNSPSPYWMWSTICWTTEISLNWQNIRMQSNEEESSSCTSVLLNFVQPFTVPSLLKVSFKWMVHFLCGFIVGCSICQVTAPHSKPPTLDCMPMTNFEMVGI